MSSCDSISWTKCFFGSLECFLCQLDFWWNNINLHGWRSHWNVVGIRWAEPRRGRHHSKNKDKDIKGRWALQTMVNDDKWGQMRGRKGKYRETKINEEKWWKIKENKGQLSWKWWKLGKIRRWSRARKSNW